MSKKLLLITGVIFLSSCATNNIQELGDKFLDLINPSDAPAEVADLSEQVLVLSAERGGFTEEELETLSNDELIELAIEKGLEDILVLDADGNLLNRDQVIKALVESYESGGFTEEELEVLSNDELIEIAKEKGLEDILVLDADGNLQNKEEVIKLTASTLKEQYELLKEQQIFNTQKINELFDMLELKFTKEAVKEVILDDEENEKKAYQIYTDGRNQFIAGDYDEAIALFKSYLDSFPNYKNVADAKLWLGRAYFANELYSQSKAIYLEFQSENPQHAKYPDSMYELSRVFFELRDIEASKTMLIKMIEKFPTHDLYKKAKQMLTELEELTIDA